MQTFLNRVWPSGVLQVDVRPSGVSLVTASPYEARSGLLTRLKLMGLAGFLASLSPYEARSGLSAIYNYVRPSGVS